MAFYYRVAAVGTGATEDPIRADIAASSWVGNTDGTEYLVKTNEPVSGLIELTFDEVFAACAELGLNADEVATIWAIEA